MDKLLIPIPDLFDHDIKCPICSVQQISIQQICNDCLHKLNENNIYISGAGINSGAGSSKLIEQLKANIEPNILSICKYGDCNNFTTDLVCHEHEFVINGRKKQKMCDYGVCTNMTQSEYCDEHQHMINYFNDSDVDKHIHNICIDFDDDKDNHNICIDSDDDDTHIHSICMDSDNENKINTFHNIDICKFDDCDEITDSQLFCQIHQHIIKINNGIIKKCSYNYCEKFSFNDYCSLHTQNEITEDSTKYCEYSDCMNFINKKQKYCLKHLKHI